LPQEIGEGGDVTDFFARLGKSKEGFLKLMELAKPAPQKKEVPPPFNLPKSPGPDSLLRQRVMRIKSQVPIAKVIGQYIKLQVSGENLTGLCPFHDDHNPSLMVYPGTSTFHCYGCGKHGDVISFLREIANLSFNQALDALEQLKSQYESESQQNH
jgi:hypothetical protein